MTPIQIDLTVMTIGATADIASTNYALKNCSSSCYEYNPLLRKYPIEVKAATIIGSTIVANELRKHNHKTLAKVVRYGITAIWLGVATSNMRK